MIGLWSALFVGPMLYFTGYALIDGHNRQVLSERGITVTGTVVRPYTTTSKGSTSYHVEYEFSPTPDGSTNSLKIREEDLTTSSNYSQLAAGSKIPIVYDPQDPYNSRINIGDLIHKQDPYTAVFILIMIIDGIFGSTYIVIMAYLIFLYAKDKYLLENGSAVCAKILREEENFSKGRKYFTVIYEFMDGDGKTVQEKRKYIPAADDPRPRFVRARDAIMKNPTAIFDPQDSSKNTLYPPATAVLR